MYMYNHCEKTVTKCVGMNRLQTTCFELYWYLEATHNVMYDHSMVLMC